MPGEWITLNVDGAGMRTYVNAPAGPAPGVVVILHGLGVDDFMLGITDRLAAEGFRAILPDLFHRQAPSDTETPRERVARLRDDEVARDVDAAVAHLRALGSPKVAILGFCMGGRVAYLMAARNPTLAAAVVFYGGNTGRAWGEGPTPFDLTAQIGCPLLGLFGEDDQNPSPEDMRRLDAELTRHGKRHEFHSYPNAGHSFMDATQPGYSAAAIAAAWPSAVDWLRRFTA
jgi:carboxymethylenebutenolidase